MKQKWGVPTIDERTGTTLPERQRIRKRYKAAKVKAARGVRSRAVTNDYRSGYDAIDFSSVRSDEPSELVAGEIERARCYDPECGCCD